MNVKKLISLDMETKDDFRERKKLCYNGWFYAIQRMDLLIISICGAGVLVILETLKFAYDKPIGNISTIKISGAFFILAIIVNFISQITGKKANFYDMVLCDQKIRCSDLPDDKEISAMKDTDSKAENYTTATDWLNTISIVLMCIALIILLTYFWVTF